MHATMRAKIVRIDELLQAEYGDRPQPPPSEPLDELVFTILSQNTTSKNYHRAYNQLKERFPTWEEVLGAPQEEVEAAIRTAGLANVKAPRIQKILRQVAKERGELSLSFLHQLPLDEAFQYLLKFDGVGPKTAACVLLFSCGMPAFPVDTHVHRLSQRLGLVPEGTSAAASQDILQELVPPEAAHRFHVNLVSHGRAVCKAQRPRCEKCVIAGECQFFSREEEGKK